MDPRQRKSRNKVSATKAKSPAALKAKTRSSTSSAGDSSRASSRSSRPGLDPFVQKELAEVLESNGGIASFIDAPEHKLAQLLDEDVDTFGKRASDLRVQVGKHRSRWIEHHKKGNCHSKVLSRWGVVAFEHRDKDTIPSDKKKKLSVDDVSDVSEPSSSDESVQASRTPSRKSKKKGSKEKKRKEKLSRRCHHLKCWWMSKQSQRQYLSQN